MTRDHSVIERCRECGSVTIVLVYEQGLDEEGERYAAFYRDVVPHPASDCERMLRLAREEWPALF